MIAEEEDETAFLDAVRLEVIMPSGEVRALPPRKEALVAVDDRQVSLKKGERPVVSFGNFRLDFDTSRRKVAVTR